MRKISAWCFAMAVAGLCEVAVAGRVQNDLSPDSHATVPGDQFRIAGTVQGVRHGSQSEPLSEAEIASRLGLERGVLVSTWDAGFPKTLTWDRQNAVDDGAGGVALRLSMQPGATQKGATGRRYRGGEFQAKNYATVWGRVEWQGRLPVGIPGSVVGMFLYKTPYTAKTDRELDLEYVPGDPKVEHEHGTMQMTLHMKRHDGSGAREKQSYRINIPARCIEAVCGWAIEFQPRTIVFQISLNQGGRWETIGRFTHGTGWDLTAGKQFNGAVNGNTQNFASDDIWSEQTVAAFVSYWCTNDQVGWLGALNERDLLAEVPQFEVKSMTLYSYDTLSQFRSGDWSVAANGEVTIANTPNDDLRLTGIEYRLDGGEWHGLSASVAGTYALPPGSSGQPIEIRSVARGPAFAKSGHEIISDPSDTKIVPMP